MTATAVLLCLPVVKARREAPLTRGDANLENMMLAEGVIGPRDGARVTWLAWL